MRQINVQVSVDETTIREIESVYGKSDYSIIASVVDAVLCRYLSVEYFDPELYAPECPDEDDGYTLCERCGEKSKRNKMIYVDGTNLEEHCVCENCGHGYLALR